jgi:hypothetical protein
LLKAWGGCCLAACLVLSPFQLDVVPCVLAPLQILRLDDGCDDKCPVSSSRPALLRMVFVCMRLSWSVGGDGPPVIFSELLLLLYGCCAVGADVSVSSPLVLALPLALALTLPPPPHYPPISFTFSVQGCDYGVHLRNVGQ